MRVGMGKRFMSYPAHAKAISLLGLPLIGGHIGQVAIGVTDTVMLGWYGVDSLAAGTLGSSYFFLFFLAGAGFAWAVMPIVASANASDDVTSMRRAARMGVWLSAVFGIVALPAMLFSYPVLIATGQEPGIAADAALYLTVAGWGLFPRSKKVSPEGGWKQRKYYASEASQKTFAISHYQNRFFLKEKSHFPKEILVFPMQIFKNFRLRRFPL